MTSPARVAPGTRQARARAALQSFFIGDALSMPVHWFYRPQDIQHAFPGGIDKMQAPPAHHPSSIMSLHSTSAGGRGTQRKGSSGKREIVGDVILRDKRQYWGVPNQHYHRGMPAGENTLNIYCARELMRLLADHHADYDETRFLDRYIEFMTAEPCRHPDTYAESWHRGFFANLERGKAANRCAALTHDTPSIGGLVMIVPLALSQLLRGRTITDTRLLCRAHLSLTHPDAQLAGVCDALVQLFGSLLARPEDSPALALLSTAGQAIGGTRLEQLLDSSISDLQVVGGHYSSACYITDSWPSLLYLAAKYQHDAAAAMLANTNVGGENAHRGAVLGAVVSLITGKTADALFSQLHHADDIATEIDHFLQRCS